MEEYWEAVDRETGKKTGKKLKLKEGGRQRQKGSNRHVRSSLSPRINGN